jgi:uncharacterized membrane protein
MKRMGKLIELGRMFFAAAMAAFGILYLLHALFGAGPGAGPPWMPAPPFWAYFTAVVCLLAAAAIVANMQVRCAAILLAVTIFLRVLLNFVPKLAANPRDPGPWTSGGELLSLCGAALVLAGFPVLVRIGRVLFALPLIIFGIQHFMYARYVATLVPSSIPGPLFWAVFVGIAFVVSAISIITLIKSRLAATWLGIMFLLWVMILHLPRVAASPHNGNEWTSAIVALAMSGAAFLVAGSLKQDG